MGYAIAGLISTILSLLIFTLVAQAILSWLVAFNVINVRNQFVYQLIRFLDRITDPLLRPLRRFVPTFGGIDITPVILILILNFLQTWFRADLYPWLRATL